MPRSWYSSGSIIEAKRSSCPFCQHRGTKWTRGGRLHFCYRRLLSWSRRSKIKLRRDAWPTEAMPRASNSSNSDQNEHVARGLLFWDRRPLSWNWIRRMCEGTWPAAIHLPPGQDDCARSKQNHRDCS